MEFRRSRRPTHVTSPCFIPLHPLPHPANSLPPSHLPLTLNQSFHADKVPRPFRKRQHLYHLLLLAPILLILLFLFLVGETLRATL